MAHASTPRFRVLHALRIKGFAKVDVLAELAAQDESEVVGHLEALQADGLAVFREARALWQLTPTGREAHAKELAEDTGDGSVLDTIRAHYPAFLDLNTEFKELCGEWQLRDGSPNDHSDHDYDRVVIHRLGDIDRLTQPVCAGFASAMERFAPYGPRLTATAARVSAGEHHLFTGVMCGSYHDVWMELHEDLILTLGIDRAAEGSY